MGYGKIWIENMWRFWDEREEVLKDRMGRRREEKGQEGVGQGKKKSGQRGESMKG